MDLLEFNESVAFPDGGDCYDERQGNVKKTENGPWLILVTTPVK